jgi:hypothetical protein
MGMDKEINEYDSNLKIGTFLGYSIFLPRGNGG